MVKNQFTFNSDSVYLRLNEVDVNQDTLYFTGFVTDTFFKNLRNIMVKSNKSGSYSKAQIYSPSLFVDNPLLDPSTLKGIRFLQVLPLPLMGLTGLLF